MTPNEKGREFSRELAKGIAAAAENLRPVMRELFDFAAWERELD